MTYIALGFIVFGVLCVVTGFLGLREWKNDSSDLLRYGLGMIGLGIAIKVLA